MESESVETIKRTDALEHGWRGGLLDFVLEVGRGTELKMRPCVHLRESKFRTAEVFCPGPQCALSRNAHFACVTETMKEYTQRNESMQEALG